MDKKLDELISWLEASRVRANQYSEMLAGIVDELYRKMAYGGSITPELLDKAKALNQTNAVCITIGMLIDNAQEILGKAKLLDES